MCCIVLLEYYRLQPDYVYFHLWVGRSDRCRQRWSAPLLRWGAGGGAASSGVSSEPSSRLPRLLVGSRIRACCLVWSAGSFLWILQTGSIWPVALSLSLLPELSSSFNGSGSELHPSWKRRDRAPARLQPRFAGSSPPGRKEPAASANLYFYWSAPPCSDGLSIPPALNQNLFSLIPGRGGGVGVSSSSWVGRFIKGLRFSHYN